MNQHSNYPSHNQGYDTPSLDTSGIEFKDKSVDLFDEVANRTAKTISQAKKGNKATQLRKYYDEIIMWEQKVRQSPDKYLEYLPFIKMLNAKVTYAKGRDLVDQNFVELMRHCTKEIKEDDIDTFYTFKLFFESFMGFYKMHKPK